MQLVRKPFLFVVVSLAISHPLLAQGGAWQQHGPLGASGTARAGAGDVNGDGFADVVVGNGSANTATVLSGEWIASTAAGQTPATPQVLATLTGVGGTRFGASVDGAGDVNGDGFDEVVVGAPDVTSTFILGGQAQIFSGEWVAKTAAGQAPATPQVLATLDGAGLLDYLGTSVAGAGDVNGDGFDDVAVGTQSLTGTPRVEVISGEWVASTAAGQTPVTNQILATLTGGSGFGEAVAGAGDVNNDGFDDVIAGRGLAEVHSGEWIARTAAGQLPATSQVLATLTGLAAHSLDGAGDVNGDGFEDVIVGAPITSSGDGRVEVHSGEWIARTAAGQTPLTSQILLGIDGVSGEFLGLSVAGAGDVDGDGFDDVAMVGQNGARVASGADSSVLTDIPCTSLVVGVGDVDCDGRDDIVTECGGGAIHGYTAVDLVGSTTNGAALGDHFGSALDMGGDYNGDGFDDYIVGAPMAFGSGRATIYSGANGAPLFTLGGSVGSQVGAAVAHVGDLDGNGTAEFAIGNPAGSGGSVSVWGSITTFSSFGAPGGTYGSCIAGVGDINLDGFPDVAVGSTLGGANGEGYVRILSGAFIVNGTAPQILVTLHGEVGDENFGFSIAGAGDVNLDGWPDIVVGAPHSDEGALDGGEIKMFSGEWIAVTAAGGTPTTAQVLYFWFSNEAFAEYGASLAALGDIDGDGVPDFGVGAPGEDVNALPDSGRLWINTGVDGSSIYSFWGNNAADRCGQSVDSAGDVDGDGVPDLTFGCNGVGGLGQSLIYSMGRFVFLDNRVGNAGDTYGSAVAGGGDVNNDGVADVIYGAPLGGANGGGYIDVVTGSAVVAAKADTYGAGCLTSAGTLPRIGTDGRADIGGTVSITMRGGPPSSLGSLWITLGRLAFPAPMPTLIANPGCNLLLDTSFVQLDVSILVDADGQMSLPLPIPNTPASVGLALAFQALFFDAPLFPKFLVVSDAVEVRIGSPYP